MTTSTQAANAGTARAPDWRTPAAATVMALALHLALLAAWPLGEANSAPPTARPALRVRQIAPAAAAPALIAATPGAAVPAAAVARRPLAAPAAHVTEPATLTRAPAIDEAAADRGGQPVPTYATRPPPAARLSFEVTRAAGVTAGAELEWRPQNDGYTLTLTTTAGGRTLLRSESSGRFDADGLAPERFVDRRRREWRAVNFEREQRRILFSGPGVEHPLQPGTQDRLSLLMQLAAIAAANPTAFDVGSEIALVVASPRGDADVWTFTVAGIEAVEVPEGSIEGVWRLLREPRRPYDIRAEIWLDPARGFLPVRVKFSPGQGGEGTEFALQRLELQ